jgi:hypothetical protein
MVSVRENSSQQNSQKTVFTQIFLITFWFVLKSEGGYWVPETLVEQSKTRNGHGSGTQIGVRRMKPDAIVCSLVHQYLGKPYLQRPLFQTNI